MSDNNYKSFAHQRPMGCFTFSLLRGPEGTTDTLKITDCADGKITIGQLFGGTEDCLDINNASERINVWADEWHSGGKFVCTVKGASKDIVLGGEIVVPGQETDIDIGNHSDQQSGRTINVYLCFTRRDKKPVRVRVLHGHRPIILNPTCPYSIDTTMKGWFSTVWDKLKKLANLFGIHI